MKKIYKKLGIAAIALLCGTEMFGQDFGKNIWNANVYDGSYFDTYKGFYPDSSLTFDSQNKWNGGDSPSSAPYYQGDPVPVDNHSVRYQRQGFPDQIYVINIDYHDDDAFLYVHGQEVFSHYGCCDSHPAVWTGILNDTSKVIFAWSEFGGGSEGAVSFVPVSPSITSLSSTTAINGDSLSIIGDYFYAIDSVRIAGQKATFRVVNSNQINALVGCGSSDQVEIFSKYGNDAIGGFTLSMNWYKDADKDGYGDPGAVLVQCQKPVGYVSNGIDCNDSDPAILPLVWFADVDGDGYGDPGNTTMSCTQPTGYVEDHTDCNDTDVRVNPTTSCGYGDHIWKAFGFNGTNFDTYEGFYTDPALTFNSMLKWDQNGSPSDAPDYVGDLIDDDNHSVKYKRKGFPDSIYVVNVTNHDDDAYMYVNGNQVFSHIGCCDSHDNVWHGILNDTSKVEFDWVEYGGGSNGGVSFVAVSPDITDLSDYNASPKDVISIYGYYFFGIDSVYVGGVPVSNFKVEDENTITAAVDCRNSGDVIIYSKYGNDTLSGFVMNQPTWFADVDGDGYGNASATVFACTKPAGYVADNTDCDDTDKNTNPGTKWFADADGDGFGDATQVVADCVAPDGYVADNGDCDDNDNNVGKAPVVDLNLPNKVTCGSSTVTLGGGTPDGGAFSGSNVSGNAFDPKGLLGKVVITYTVTSGTCVVSSTDTIVVDICTGTSGSDGAETIEVYPNPTDGIVTVVNKGTQQIQEISLHTMKGETLFVEKAINSATTTQTLDLSAVASGMYYLKITRKGSVEISKIAVAK